MKTEALIEAILFWHTEPMTMAELTRAIGRGETEIREALAVLDRNLESRGVQLVYKDDEVMLGSHPEASEVIERLAKEEMSQDLGRASLETLTIVLYRGPVSRARIDYLRGVNSSFILRHLMIRGLVERVPNPEDARSFLYRPTFELLQNLGVKRVEDLPDYASLVDKL
ncbi:SMC-Scp complex subunit ScpB [Candidatus Nomurabacteria bacterium]|nr:SMC-Scp complex subunit ScpB [Candidatus Nomurabacteria bacterium]